MSDYPTHMISWIRVDAVGELTSIKADVEVAMNEKRPWLMTFVNPGSSAIARRNSEFQNALRRFDVVAPDGIAIVYTLRWLMRYHGRRISFDQTSLAPVIFTLAQARQTKIALCGGLPGVTERAANRLREAFPQLNIAGTFDGYSDRSNTIGEIIELRPDMVICGMGGSLQENFLLKLVDNGWSGIGFTCGGYFDQLCDGVTYYPKWVDTANLRFAYRLIREPRRLWRRYLLEYPSFWYGLIPAFLGAN